jgi:hypothetical protein
MDEEEDVDDEEYVKEHIYYNDGGSRFMENEDDDCQIIERHPPRG